MTKHHIVQPALRAIASVCIYIACKIIGHRYRVTRVLNYGAMQVTCKTCGRLWAMHHDTKSFLPWDADFEALYSPHGVLGNQPPQPLMPELSRAVGVGLNELLGRNVRRIDDGTDAAT